MDQESTKPMVPTMTITAFTGTGNPMPGDGHSNGSGLAAHALEYLAMQRGDELITRRPRLRLVRDHDSDD